MYRIRTCVSRQLASTPLLRPRLPSPSTSRSTSSLPPRPSTSQFSGAYPPICSSSPLPIPPRASVFAALRRTFSSTPSRGGIRPYYGRQSYRRGAPNWRTKFDDLPENYIVLGLIGMNVVVYGAWAYGGELRRKYRDPSWLMALTNNFTTSKRNLMEGRVWTLVTSCFSHEGTGHILMNMASLYFMAGPVIGLLGNVGFVTLYLFSGLTSSAVSLAFHQLVGGSNPNYSSHGASGAVYGVITYFAAVYPRTTFLLFFVVPVPAWICVSGIIAWDAYSSFNRPGGQTDSAAHLGGAGAGLLWFLRRIGRV